MGNIENGIIAGKIEKPASEELEKLRNILKRKKEKQSDIHFKEINPDELLDEDLLVYDKFKRNLSIEENLKSFWASAETQAKEGAVDTLTDSRSNFYAWLTNRINSRALYKTRLQIKKDRLKNNEK